MQNQQDTGGLGASLRVMTTDRWYEVRGDNAVQPRGMFRSGLARVPVGGHMGVPVVGHAGMTTVQARDFASTTSVRRTMCNAARNKDPP